MLGTSGTGTNPEQLFAAAWSACYLSAFKIVAHAMKVNLPPDVAIDAEVDLGQVDRGHAIQARLIVGLPGIEHEVAHKLVDAAHLQCSCSKATHGNVSVVSTVRTESAAQVA